MIIWLSIIISIIISIVSRFSFPNGEPRLSNKIHSLSKEENPSFLDKQK